MKPLGCLGLIGAFAAGCTVTFALMTLRPLADPIGQLLFESKPGENAPHASVGEQLESAVRTLTASFHAEGAVRTWTHKDGRHVRAALLSATAHSVTIKRESDGRTFTIRHDMLSATDRQFIQGWLATKQ